MFSGGLLSASSWNASDMSEKSLLLLGDDIIKMPVTKCGAHVAASIQCITSYVHSWMHAWHILCIASCLQCWMSVGQECSGVSCLQELQQQLGEIIVLLVQHEQAYDLTEGWAVRIADEVTAHIQAIQKVEDAKLRLSAQPSSNSAAASLSKRDEDLAQLRRRFERVSAETLSLFWVEHGSQQV